MSDRDHRADDRRAAGGDFDASVRALVARVRRGEVDRLRVDLAAWCGDAVAAAISEPSTAKTLATWLAGFGDFGVEVQTRAAVAGARRILTKYLVGSGHCYCDTVSPQGVFCTICEAVNRATESIRRVEDFVEKATCPDDGLGARLHVEARRVRRIMFYDVPLIAAIGDWPGASLVLLRVPDGGGESPVEELEAQTVVCGTCGWTGTMGTLGACGACGTLGGRGACGACGSLRALSVEPGGP